MNGTRATSVEFLPLLTALAIACIIAVLSIRNWAVYEKWRSDTVPADFVGTTHA